MLPVLVCADMLELGKRSKALHRSIGRSAVQSGVNVILSYGWDAALITSQAKKTHSKFKAFHYRNLTKLHKNLDGLCCPGDIILVKGSRGMRTERTVDFLKRKVFR